MTLCVNDLHLQADTRQGNIADRAPETLRGERNGNAKLTRFDIIAIKTLWGLGFSQKQIASQFNIQPNHIYRIHSHRKWGWL